MKQKRFFLAESEDPKENDIEEFLKTINFTFKPYEKHAFYSEYKLNVTPEDFLSAYVSEQEEIDLKEYFFYYEPTFAIKISDYNAIRKLRGYVLIVITILRLTKWRETILRRGIVAEKLTPKIVKCYVRSVIDERVESNPSFFLHKITQNNTQKLESNEN